MKAVIAKQAAKESALVAKMKAVVAKPIFTRFRREEDLQPPAAPQEYNVDGTPYQPPGPARLSPYEGRLKEMERFLETDRQREEQKKRERALLEPRAETVGGQIGQALEIGVEGTVPGLMASIAAGKAPRQADLNTWQAILSEITSFVADPTTYLGLGVGGIVGRGVAKQAGKKALTKTAQKMLVRGAGGGAALGAMTAIKAPFEQLAHTGEYSPLQHLEATGKSTLLGAAAGLAGMIPKVGLPAEIGAFGTGSPLLEGRLPAVEDYVHATGVILGIKTATGVGRVLGRLSRGESLTKKETATIAEVSPEQRAAIAVAARQQQIAATKDAIENPSRKNFQKAGFDTSGELSKAENRQKVADDLGKAVQAEQTEQAKPQAEAAKQPWEMTRKEYQKTPYGYADEAHRRLIVDAIAQGENIPPEVLKEHPSIALEEAPWLLTKAQWEREVRTRRAMREHIQGVRQKMGEEAVEEGFVTPAEGEEGRPTTHRADVEAAVIQGKPVPAEVLKDYPDLTPPPEPKIGAKKLPEPVEPIEEPSSGTMGVASLDDVAAQSKRGMNAAAAFAKRFFTSKGDLPKEAFDAKISRDGWVNSQMKQVAFTLRDFDKAAKTVYGGRKKMSAHELGRVDAVLKGEEGAHVLPEAMREVIGRMRDEIDALSQHLIDVGVIEGDLIPAIEENIGFYTKRSYQVFDDPNWAKKVPAEVRNNAKALLRSEYPDKTEAQIHGLIDSLLYEGKAAESPIALLSRSKLGSKDLSILQRRKDFPVEIRALFGEYTDPRVNYARSVTMVANLIANQQFLNDVRTAGLERFLHEEPVTNEAGAFITRIAADQSSVMSPLNGLYTTPEIKGAFERAFDQGAAPDWLRGYMKVNGTVKFAKTVGSLMTHVRNVLGNTGFAVANGHWRIWKMQDAFKGVAASIGVSNNPEWRAYFRRALEQGVVHESARAGELQDVVRDASKQTVDQFMDRTAERLGKRVLRTTTDIYRAEDDLWKLYAWENEKAKYRKARPDLTDGEIEKLTAQIVRNTYPTYSLVPEGVKLLRRFPLVGTFVSFPAEVARTGYNTVELAAREMTDPRTRGIGTQRAIGVLVAAGGTAAVAAASRHLFGVTRDEDDDLRRFLPPWSENSQIVHLGKGDNGNLRFIDLSYTDPYEYLKKPIIALLRGDNWQDAMVKAMFEAAEPFVGEEILAEKLLDWSRNRKKNGGQVYQPADPFDRQLQDTLAHILDAMEPGTITSMRRIYRGLTGTVSTYGRSYDPTLESIAVLTGHRLQELDVAQALSYKAREFQRKLSEATSVVSRVASRRGTVTDAELTEAFQSTDAARKKLYAEMYKRARAAVRLGMAAGDVREVLRASGMSKKNVELVVSGDYEPYQPSSAFLRSAMKVADVLPKEGAADVDEFARRRQQVTKLAFEQMEPEKAAEAKTKRLGSLMYALTGTKTTEADRAGVWREITAFGEIDDLQAIFVADWIARGNKVRNKDGTLSKAFRRRLAVLQRYLAEPES